MPRTHSWPAGHWDWPIHVSHKHGIRVGEMIHVGGQVDLDSSGNVLHPNDIRTQTAAVMANIGKVLAGFGADLRDLTKLVAFYQAAPGANEEQLLADIARAIPGDAGPVVTLVPLPALAYPGMVVEIEAIAMLGRDGARLKREAVNLPALRRLPKPLSHGLRCGRMIWTGGLDAMDGEGRITAAGDLIGQSKHVMERIGDVLGRFGADHNDAVKINIYYTGGGRFEDWEGAARTRAAYFTEPGPAATGIPVPRHADEGIRTRIEITAMRGEDGKRLPREHVWPKGHWDWPIHLPYKHGIKCGEMIYIGGQVALTPEGQPIDFDNMVSQTRIAMDNIRKVLAGFGAGFDDVVKVLAFYEGGASGEALHENLKIRSGCFTEPGPASTGIPFPALAYDGMVIEIDITAMQE